MGITHETSIRNGLANYIASQVDADTAAGKIKIYSDTGLTTLLATFTLAATAFGSASGGTITAAAITPITASANGTALVFVVTDGADNQVYRGDCGVSGSGAACILNTTTLTAGGALSVNSCTYSAPV